MLKTLWHLTQSLHYSGLHLNNLLVGEESKKLLLIISARAIDIFDLSVESANILATSRKDKELHSYSLDGIDAESKKSLHDFVAWLQKASEIHNESVSDVWERIQNSHEVIWYEYFSQPRFSKNFQLFLVDKDFFKEYEKWWNHPGIVAFHDKFPELHERLVHLKTIDIKSPLIWIEYNEFVILLYLAYCYMMNHETHPLNREILS